MLYSRGNLMVSKVASDNPMDVGINCIRLETDGSTVAANGDIIVAVGPVNADKVHFPDVGEHRSLNGEGLSVPLDLVDKAIRNIPKGQAHLQYVALTKHRDEKRVELTTTDMRQEQRVAGFPKPEPFPDWKNALRKLRGGGGGARICLNRQDLVQLLQALEEACPDRGGENPVYLEINSEGKGVVLRCLNRENSQRAVGGISAYNTGGQWLPSDSWEQMLFQVQPKRILTTPKGS